MVFLLIFLMLILVLWICKINLAKNVLLKIPSPPGFPILGNIPDLFFQTPESLFETMRKFSKQYPIYRLSLGPVSIINMSNSEDIEQVLSSKKHLTKSKLYSYLTPWLGTGLLTSTGEKWHFRRKLLTPAFHFKILQEYLIIFNRESQRFVKIIMENIDKDVDIIPFVTKFTLHTVGETSMGFQDIDENTLKVYRNDVKRIGELIIYRLMRPWYDINFLYALSWSGKQEKNVVKKLHNFSNNIIKKRQQIKKSLIDLKKSKLMLDLLLEAKENGANIDDEGIREEVDTFMFEGHDTTSSAISMILLQLANNEDIQEKAAQEIDKIIGTENVYTYQHLKCLKYMENCIKEGLRLYPSVYLISRFAGEDFITKTGFKILHGTTLHLHLYDLHRNSKIFPDPEKFDPDRFLPGKLSGVNPYSYIPFSAGPRNCIGQKFAMLEMKVILCRILQHFKLKAVDKVENVKFRADLVLKTSNPIRIKFIKK